MSLQTTPCTGLGACKVAKAEGNELDMQMARSSVKSNTLYSGNIPEVVAFETFSRAQIRSVQMLTPYSTITISRRGLLALSSFSVTRLPTILLLQQLRNSGQLNITRPLIDSPNLTIPKHLLRNTLPHEPHPAHPFNRLSTNPSRYL